ncbi:hypothetical protein K438DRAFT_1773306 [Mycena galopus ATCC 62051]|nr:hypothetical protein K438DRAFT_1773306 [Mycena galopus ATCC 62051]
MRFNTILISIIFSAGLAVSMTLPEAIEAEKRQCLGPNANCFLTNPGACCSGQCCCGFDSAFGDGCTDTSCDILQEEGRLTGGDDLCVGVALVQECTYSIASMSERFVGLVTPKFLHREIFGSHWESREPQSGHRNMRAGSLPKPL